MDDENPDEVLKKEDVLEVRVFCLFLSGKMRICSFAILFFRCFQVIQLEGATDPAGEEIDEDIEAGDDEDQQSTSK